MVRIGEQEFVLRLFTVDAPESDACFPDRIDEQSACFGIMPAESIAAGRKIRSRVVRGLALALPCRLLHSPSVQKKSSRRLARVNAVAEKLRFLPHLSEDERVLYAWSLAATPDERWRRHENFLRSHGLFMHSARKRSGLSS